MLFSNLCRHSRFAFFTPLLDASVDKPEDADILSGGGVKRARQRMSEYLENLCCRQTNLALFTPPYNMSVEIVGERRVKPII